MQNFSEKVEVRQNEGIGRHIVASLDMAPGEMVLEEKPLFIAPHWDCEQMKCTNCFLDSFVMCKKCQLFPLCMDCTEHNEFDCGFFSDHATQVSKNLLVKNYAIFAALKLLLLLENPETSTACEELFTRQINLSDFDNTEMWQEHEEQIVTPLLLSNIADAFKRVKVDANFLHQLCILIDTNAFEVTSREGDSLKGVYTFSAQLPHNCIPNTVTALDVNFQMCIYAAVPIKREDIIYNSYVNPLMGTSQRQHHLRMTRNIQCACARCLDPTELGTHMSSIKCKNCEPGYAICDISALKDGKIGDWRCQECKTCMDAIAVRTLLAEVSEEMLGAYDGLKAYESLLAKYAPVFHPNHFLLIDIKQNIAAILRAKHLNPCSQSGKKALARRVQLYEEMLPVVRAVVPGISKLYAIASFEYLLPFLELSEIGFKTKTITKEDYTRKLEEAKQMTNDVMEMLSFEPPNSPEEHLAQRLNLEHKRIVESLRRLALK